MNAIVRRSGGPTPRRKSVLAWLGSRIKFTDARFWGSFFSTETWAGEHVTPQRAMQLSAVWSAVRLNAQTMASLPKGVFEDRGDEGPKATPGTNTGELLASPNDEQTPMEFWEQMFGCMELVGDGMARKHMIGQRTRALTLMDPMRTTTRQNVMGGWEHRYVDDKGRELILSPDDVFHLKGFSMGGPRGMSTVAYGAQTMALAIAANKTSGKLFKSGLRSSGFVNTQGILEEPDRTRLNKILAEYTGQENAGGIMILEGGMEYKQLSMSAADAELLLSRRFEIEEIGRWFGMPPILLGHAVEGQTMWGSGVDSIIQAWKTLGLRHRIVRVQETVRKRLMTTGERAARLYMKVNADALLAVDSEARARFLGTLGQNGFITRNEGRKKLELGAMPGGDVLTAQVNLVPLDQLGQSSPNDAQQLRAQFRAWLGIEDPEPPREDAPPNR